MKIIVADLESDGLLDTITRIHCICTREIIDGVQGENRRFRRNAVMDNIREGLEYLNTADVVVFHNGIDFDIPAMELIYPDWSLSESVRIRDTLVMSRMQKSNIKDVDYRLHEHGKLEGKLIGTHGLEGWGQRLGNWKGDYAKVKEAEAREKGITDKAEILRYVWGEWNQEMEDYCAQDIDVTVELWEKLDAMGWSEEALRLEHRMAYIMHLQEQFGFTFDVDKAKELAANLEADYTELSVKVVAEIGQWYAPKKKYKNAPREHAGEDASRKVWAEVTYPAKDTNYKVNPDRGFIAPTEFRKDAPFCHIEYKEFNPNSRPQIIDRLQTIYGWTPVDFTENGTPEVNDDVLRTLAKDIPICEDLAELFFLNKLLGMVQNGKNGWLGLVKEDGAIHGHVTVGGTISGRASHSNPNCGQIPKVAVADVKRKDGTWNPKVLDKSGNPLPFVYDADGNVKKKSILPGRAGKYGFECRSLFTAPPGWVMMGCDLSGIELRCLAARLAEFDNGAYVEEVLNGDPHTRNQIAFGLDSRDNAKTCLYAIMYGGGDLKVGSIVMPPSASEDAMKQRGKQLKANLQNGIPAFGKLIKKVGKQAGRGYLDGLDGRKLWVRSKHAALNLQLQSDAALISKLWVIFFYDMMHDAGYEWGRDWAQVAWVHDEIQACFRTQEIAEHAAEICVQAAKEAGEYFGYAAPVGAEAKFGMNWAETH